MAVKDPGPKPYAFQIEEETVANTDYRNTVWTGVYFQVTLMSIPVGKSIGLEMHPETDQFIRLESGKGRATLGPTKDNLDFQQDVEDGWAVMVPAGTWHDVINTGDEPMTLYSIYAPVHHAEGIIQPTFEDAVADGRSGKDVPPDYTSQPGTGAHDQF